MMYAFAAIAWLGFVVHNVADLPGQTLISSETLWPTAVTAVLLLLYAFGPRRAATIGILAWAALHFMGGIVSVLPLPFLPFEPDQTLRHYSFHVLYALTQVPLVAVSWQEVRRPTTRA
ncbi:hypothetical protein ACQPXM_11800 [Kribbella sp. CA-253562]|uniref:hypothetical protein n=1 Tax=Kribbella sp. CA-253562 TaxID=3239942 RepID=UPI003D8DEE76